jgi:hypothetical protein
MHRADPSNARRYVMKLVLFVIAVLTAAAAPASTVTELVLQAREEGEISADQAALYLTYSVVSPDRLPAWLTGPDAEFEPSGTPALHEVQLMMDQLTEATKERILQLTARPQLSGPEYTFDSPQGYFKIHWTDVGEDATTRGYCDEIAEGADSSWIVECNQLGYNEPPSDLGAGGDEKYDIYVMRISALGYCSHSGEPGDPSTPNNDSASHIVISNVIYGWGQKVCTVSHEFQHACQFAYDVAEPTWFMENCAVWMEEQVYPSINDYSGYISGESALRKPWYDIRSGAMYWYGAFTYPWFIEERIHIDAVREIWELCADTLGMNMLGAHHGMYRNHGMTFEQAMMEYGMWRWFTEDNWFEGCGYSEESSTWYPGPYCFTGYHWIDQLPDTVDNISDSYDPDTYGLHWIIVDVSAYQGGWVNMAFDGRDNFEWNLAIVRWDEGVSNELQWFDVPEPSGEIELAAATEGWDYLVFFPMFLDETSIEHYYEGIITYSTGCEEEQGSGDGTIELRTPNPILPGGSVEFDMVADGRAEIALYELSGRRVATICDDTFTAGSHSVSMQTDLPVGTYLITLYANDQVATRKVCLTR